MFYVREGRHREAVVVLRRALDIEPGNASRRLWLGTALGAIEELDLAKAELARALETANRSTAGYIHAKLGEIYEQERNRAEAIKAFRRAVEILQGDQVLKERLRRLEGH